MSTVHVSVTREGEHFIANIDGWWIATGKTPKAAADNVVRAYETELGAHGVRDVSGPEWAQMSFNIGG